MGAAGGGRGGLVGSCPLNAGVGVLLAAEWPNEARGGMVRMGGARAAKHEIAEMLVKSTSAICTAIGAQPIPLADLPILTTLQLVMVSGIMYVSGRERSMRAATEFVGMLGANVGGGLILREGKRDAVKFSPGGGKGAGGSGAGGGAEADGGGGRESWEVGRGNPNAWPW